MTSLRLRSERGPLTPAGVEYGRSALGAPLLWFPA
ncbi:murein peptide amidase A, partial [Chimaeribacter arupi]